MAQLDGDEREKAEKDSRIAELERQLQKLSAKEKRIKAAYQNGIDTLEEYKANKISKDEYYERMRRFLWEKHYSKLPDFFQPFFGGFR